MRLLFLALLVVCSMQGCAQRCRVVSFDSWSSVDRIVLEVPGEHEKRTIDDPAVIQKVHAFLIRRTDGWDLPFPDTPLGPLRLDAYQGSKGITYLAVGEKFIEAPGCGYAASRRITAAERREILSILGVAGT
jgi:hypothetical protein